MLYNYKTISGVERKIEAIKNHIATLKRLRGKKGNGTFWEDVAKVDESISDYEKEIGELELQKQILLQDSLNKYSIH